jgi:hypothetical protein
VPEDHVLVNPKGRALPPHWKTDRLPHLADADEEEIKTAAREIIQSFIAEGTDDIEAMKRAAAEAGVSWDELRVVPTRVVNRYYGQFIPTRGATKGGRVYDTAVDFTAASIVFARLGYIPKNIAQNLIMSVPHQGPFMLVNIPRAAQALADPELRHLLSGEVGFSGPTQGIGREFSGYGSKSKGIPSRVAGVVGGVADTPLRISAFLHEAAAEGVIPKLSPFLTDADKAKLKALFLDPHPAKRALLNDIRSRSVESMGDFSRLTPSQRKWARRFLIIPGWLWAGSRYPVHFAATHPVRSAAIGYAAAGEPYADRLGLPQNRPITDYMAKGLPYYLEGFDTPWGVQRTTSLSPVSTPWEMFGAATGSSPRAAASYANPLATTAYNIAAKQVGGSFGTYRTDTYREAARRNAERLFPNYDFARDLINPSGEGRYPEDASRLGRIKRELGVFPLEIIRDKKTGAKAENEAELKEMRAGITKHLPPKYRAAALRDLGPAYAQKTQVDQLRAEIQKDTDSGEPYYKAIFPAELDLAVKWKFITPKIAAERKRWASSASFDELKTEVTYFRERILGDYNETINDIEAALKYYGWKG